MSYIILKASDYQNKLKAAIHATGKLGFSENTAKELGFNESRDNFIKLAQDDEAKEVLYLINNTENDDEAFKVYRAGRYYYVNTKLLFDALGLDYSNRTLIFDMTKEKNEDLEIYRMKLREVKRKQ